MSKADAILHAASGHMAARAKQYDCPGGERSMAAAVEAFNALTGHRLTEAQGWMFMVCLKLSRSQTAPRHADNYEDGCAYIALQGEAATERGVE